MVSLIVPPSASGFTPEQFKRQTEYGQGLMGQAASMAPRGGSGPLQAIAAALQGAMGGAGVHAAEQNRLDAQQRAAGMFQHLTEAGKTPTLADMLQLAGSTDAQWFNPMQSNILSGMVESELKKGQPSWKTITDPTTGDVLRYNENDPNSKPTLFYDAPVDPQKAANLTKTQQEIEKGKIPEIKELYDKEGRPIKVQWAPDDPSTKETGGWKQIGGAKLSEGWTITTDKDGNTTITQGGKGGKTTESQAKAGNYLTRMAGSSKTIDDLEGTMSSGWSVKDRAAGDILPPSVAGLLKSSDFKRGEQAGKEWLTALLRGDSGGVISPEEELSYGRIYLPQTGDDAAVLKQKRAARKRAEAGMAQGATPEQMLQIEQNIIQNPDAAPPPPPDQPDATVEVP